MHYILKTFLVFTTMLIMASCASTVVSNGGSSSSSSQYPANQKKETKVYDENLAVYRPNFKQLRNSLPAQTTTGVSTTIADERNLVVNRRLDAMLDSMAFHNKNLKYVNGFRIQLYVGNDRKQADDTKVFVYTSYPEIFPYISFQQPLYKVKVGDFLTRLDAERYYRNMREVYPSAIIVPDVVELKKGMLVK
jgi:hypothetical protein